MKQFRRVEGVNWQRLPGHGKNDVVRAMESVPRHPIFDIAVSFNRDPWASCGIEHSLPGKRQWLFNTRHCGKVGMVGHRDPITPQSARRLRQGFHVSMFLQRVSRTDPLLTSGDKCSKSSRRFLSHPRA